MKVLAVVVFALAVGSISADPLDVVNWVSTAMNGNTVDDLIKSITDEIGNQALATLILVLLNPVTTILGVILGAGILGVGPLAPILELIKELVCALIKVIFNIEAKIDVIAAKLKTTYATVLIGLIIALKYLFTFIRNLLDAVSFGLFSTAIDALSNLLGELLSAVGITTDSALLALDIILDTLISELGKSFVCVLN